MLLTDELNGVRSRVAARLGVALAPLPVPAYESGLHGGRDRDPDWPALFEQAWLEVCVEQIGRPLETIAELASLGIRPPPALLIPAEERASRMMATEEAQATSRGAA